MTGDGRRETGDGRRETGDGRRETGDGRRETEVRLESMKDSVIYQLCCERAEIGQPDSELLVFRLPSSVSRLKEAD